jgi:ankyrin repeat protein
MSVHHTSDDASESRLLAIQKAIRNNDQCTIKQILTEGADPTIENDKGEIPLDIAMSENNTSIVEYLKAAEFLVTLSHFCCWWLAAANDKQMSADKEKDKKVDIYRIANTPSNETNVMNGYQCTH